MLDLQRKDFDRGWDDVARVMASGDQRRILEVRTLSFMPEVAEGSVFSDDRAGAELPFRYLGRVEAIKTLAFRDAGSAFRRGPSPAWQGMIRRAETAHQSPAGLREAVLESAMNGGDFGRLGDDQRQQILDEQRESQIRSELGGSEPPDGPKNVQDLFSKFSDLQKFASGDPSQTWVGAERPPGSDPEVSPKIPPGHQVDRGSERT